MECLSVELFDGQVFVYGVYSCLVFQIHHGPDHEWIDIKSNFNTQVISNSSSKTMLHVRSGGKSTKHTDMSRSAATVLIIHFIKKIKKKNSK